MTTENEDFLGGESSEKPAPVTRPSSNRPSANKENKPSIKTPEKPQLLVEEVQEDEPAPQVTAPRPMKSRVIRMLPDDLPVSKRMAPPLTRRKHAHYKLLRAGGTDGRIQEEWLRRIEVQPFEMTPRYTVYDPFEENITRRNKVLEFIDGTETYTFHNQAIGRDEQRVANKVVNPVFINGTILIDIEKHYLQFLWFELHPRNESNKRRDTSKPAIFKRVDLEHVNPYLQVVKMNLKGDADNYVRHMSHQKRVALATALNIPTTYSPGDLELILRRMAQDDPEKVMFTAPDAKGAIKLRIHEALQNDILEFHQDTLQWMFSSDNEQLHLVLEGKDPVDDLAQYLQSDRGKKDYEDIQQQLDYYKV